jgi:hypothetical protein
MHWFRSHQNRITWLACIALSWQLALSFGHVHVAKLVGNFGIASCLVVDGPSWPVQGHGPQKGPTDLADQCCWICNSIRLANTLIVPILPTLDGPYFVFGAVPRLFPQVGPERFAQLRLQARGPPRV